jgi:hypothetical protein
MVRDEDRVLRVHHRSKTQIPYALCVVTFTFLRCNKHAQLVFEKNCIQCLQSQECFESQRFLGVNIFDCMLVISFRLQLF